MSNALLASDNLTSPCNSTKIFNFGNDVCTELKFSNAGDQNITFRIKVGKELTKEEEEKRIQNLVTIDDITLDRLRIPTTDN